MSCSFCNKEVPELYHIRGREACIKCQIEFLWDFVEGTRRMVEGYEEVVHITTSINSPPMDTLVMEKFKYDFSDSLTPKQKKGLLKE